MDVDKKRSITLKKIINNLLIIILFIPCIVNAAECDTSKVYIESIGIENSSGNVEELEEATAKDKTVNLNLQMSTKDDVILYKVVLKNDSSEDYEINKNSININSDYLEYSLESDNDNIIKANTTKTIYLRVKYSKEVDSFKFVDGVYQDEITMKVNLKSDDTISNPNTGLSYLTIISLILIISGVLLILLKNKKLSTLLILLGLITLPLGVKSLCNCEIVVYSKVKIQTEEQFRLIFKPCYGNKEEYNITYKIGMTFKEFFNSHYYENVDLELQNQLKVINNIETDLTINKIAKDSYDLCLNAIEWPKEEDYSNNQEFLIAWDNANAKSKKCLSDNETSTNINEKINNKIMYSINTIFCFG